MAAELVLTFAAEAILTKLTSLVSQELTLAWGFNSELHKLAESLSTIQDFLRSATDQTRPHDQGEAVERWVMKLNQVAEDADDVLDDLNYELLRRKVAQLHKHSMRKVVDFVSGPSNSVVFRVKMASRIRKINESLGLLKNEAGFINLVAKRGDSRPAQQLDAVQTDSFFENGEEVIGREDVAREIVSALMSSDNQQKSLSVMAIVGMAGLGKTTLAKSVYNEPAIGAYFNQRIWVCVSNAFEVDRILSQMVDSLVPEKAGVRSQDALLKILREGLAGKRYFLVLDDVWNEEREKWDRLMSCLSKLNSNPGSCIIVTTRSIGVSSIAETLPRPELRNLSNEECWSIIRERALTFDNKGFIDAEQAKIGRSIAEKCGGIPLVAKVLGSIMRSRASKAEWLLIQDSEIWELPEEEDRIMSVLKLSFDNLKSPHVKQCFAYCSILGKDFGIERDKLIQLWMGQGLLQTSTVKNQSEMEHTGKVYLNILLNNSLFQEVIEGGTVIKYTMHDLVHDLAEKVSKSERLTHDLNDTFGVRHVGTLSSLENMSEMNVRRLRTLFSFDEVPDNIFSKLKALRVLSLDTEDIEELPSSIGKLKHLRYLDLSNTRIKTLPKSIGKLLNLQTLRMQNCDLNELPMEMQNLINLRHLYVDDQMRFPARMFRGLTNIQTLSCFNVGKEKGCGIEELGGLNQLKGTLTIRNLDYVRDEAEAKKARLEEKENVEDLNLVFCEDRLTNNINDENVLEGLQPQTESGSLKIESIRIEFFMGERFPSWMMKNPLSLKNLKKLALCWCSSCGELPILGHLPFLRDVEINGMDKLIRLGSEIYGYDLVYEATREQDRIVLFPALRTLSIGGCHELAEWMEAPTGTMTKNVEAFPCLENLTIDGCPSIGVILLPYSLASLRELRIQSCNTLSSIGITSSQGLPSLKDMIIQSCDGLSALPSWIENCTSLELLYVFRCKNLETMSFTRVHPSLLKLRVDNCDNLACLTVPEYSPSLQELTITQCPNLASVTFSADLNPCLKELLIEECNRLSLPDLHNITSLRALCIGACAGIESMLSEFNVPVSLEVLQIYNFHNMERIPCLDDCTSLIKLGIFYCEKLKFLPMELSCLARLEDLDLGPFSQDLDSFPDFQVQSQHLFSLKLYGWPKLKILPEQVQHLTSLRRLHIESFSGVETLPEWLGNLTSVWELSIWSCGNLKYLPTLGAMQRLTNLQRLYVFGCPLLKQRCAKDGGEEWHKISHIPIVNCLL